MIGTRPIPFEIFSSFWHFTFQVFAVLPSTMPGITYLVSGHQGTVMDFF